MLQPIPILSQPLEVVAMDFIPELPKDEGYNNIQVIMDELTKYAIFIPTTTIITAKETAELFFQHGISQYGKPRQVIQVISNIISYKYLTPMLQSHTQAETTMIVTATSVIKVWRVNQDKEQQSLMLGLLKMAQPPVSVVSMQQLLSLLLLEARHIHIHLDHMAVKQIHLLTTTMTRRRLLQILFARTFRNLSKTPINIFEIMNFEKWKDL
jgi:hypothetical protein